MSRRSAPFVAPSYIDDPISSEGKKHAKALLSTLQEDIASFRDEQFPPDILRQVRDMPIYEGNIAEVKPISSVGIICLSAPWRFILRPTYRQIICHYQPALRYRNLSIMFKGYI